MIYNEIINLNEDINMNNKDKKIKLKYKAIKINLRI